METCTEWLLYSLFRFLCNDVGKEKRRGISWAVFACDIRITFAALIFFASRLFLPCFSFNYRSTIEWLKLSFEEIRNNFINILCYFPTTRGFSAYRHATNFHYTLLLNESIKNYENYSVFNSISVSHVLWQWVLNRPLTYMVCEIIETVTVQ